MDNGILRVGGQLNKASLPIERKHPVILPRHSHISLLILRHIHRQLRNAGRNHMLSNLRYWIHNANSAVRAAIANCVICRRLRGQLRASYLFCQRHTHINPQTANFAVLLNFAKVYKPSFVRLRLGHPTRCKRSGEICSRSNEDLHP